MANQQYSNEMRFVIYPSRAQKNPKAPDHYGSMTIEGKEYSLSAWIRQGRFGEFLIGAIEEARDHRSAEPAAQPVEKQDDQPW